MYSSRQRQKAEGIRLKGRDRRLHLLMPKWPKLASVVVAGLQHLLATWQQQQQLQRLQQQSLLARPTFVAVTLAAFWCGCVKSSPQTDKHTQREWDGEDRKAVENAFFNCLHLYWCLVFNVPSPLIPLRVWKSQQVSFLWPTTRLCLLFSSLCSFFLPLANQ